VERNFVTREYQEKAMDRAVRDWLREARIDARFVPARVGDDEYHVTFPFVAFDDDAPRRVIKPLNLEQDDATRIVDHGGQWIVRLNALKKRGLLPPAVLFTVDGPDDGAARGRACREVIDELGSAGALVTAWPDRKALIDFAAQ